MIHYATKKMRIPSTCKYIDANHLEKSECLLNEILGNRSATCGELYSSISTVCNVPNELAKLLFKYHYENGLIYFKNVSENPYKEIRNYYLLKDVLDLTEDEDEQEHINKLVQKYIKSFGPVSFSDICWWTGMGYRKVEEALLTNRDEITIVELKNSKIKAFVCASESETIGRVHKEIKDRAWCKFMSYEDSALKAYYETRFLYSENPSEYYNRIGEIYATIILNGKCIGTWDLDLKDKRVHIANIECNNYSDLILRERDRMESLLF